MDDIRYSDEPNHRHFRFPDERQSGPGHVLPDSSPGCKLELCRFASKAVVMSRASGSDEQEQPGLTAPLLGCSTALSRPVENWATHAG